MFSVPFGAGDAFDVAKNHSALKLGCLISASSSSEPGESPVNRSCGSFCVLMSEMVVSENSGIPKSSILIGFSIINHPFWGSSIFGNTFMVRDGTCRT